jgi:toxin ParE1/3/4
MEGTKELQVRISKEFNIDLDDIYQYGIETFGLRQVQIYENEIWQLVDSLSHNYLLFPECRHLPTKSKMYRWIILDAHLIIYRITESEIQVLRIIHEKRSITNIKAIRSVRL